MKVDGEDLWAEEVQALEMLVPAEVWFRLHRLLSSFSALAGAF